LIAAGGERVEDIRILSDDKGLLRLLGRPFAALPSSVTERYFRSDSAAYYAPLLKYLVREGIGFAIPMSMAQPLIEQIHRTGRVVRVHLGVVIQDVTPDLARAMGLPQPSGALVAEVVMGSPAAQAGIQPGDVIVSFNDHDIRVSRNLPTQVARTQPGQNVPIVVIRAGRRTTLQATMVARPLPPASGPMSPWPTWPPQAPPQQPFGGIPGPQGAPGSPYGP